MSALSDTDGMGAPEPMAETYIPAGSVLGTREYPFTASQATAGQFVYRRNLCSNAQRVAKIRVAAGLAVDWDTWASTLARLRQWLVPGFYQSEDWSAPQRWPDLTPETLLLGGKGAPFRRRADVPGKVYAVVERAIEAAKVAGPSILSPSGVARMLNITAAFRREHRLWWLGAVDATKEEIRRQSSRRTPEAAERRREASRAKKETKRREDRKMSRAEYLDRAALIREACALAGISRDTFDRRDEGERERLLNAARIARAESAGAGRPLNNKAPCLQGPTLSANAPDAPKGARPSGWPPRGGDVHCRNRANAVERKPGQPGRKRAAHPPIADSARPFAAKEAATGPSAPLTESPATSGPASKPDHQAPPQSSARHGGGEKRYSHALLRGPEMPARLRWPIVDEDRGIGVKGSPAAFSLFLGSVVRWLTAGAWAGLDVRLMPTDGMGGCEDQACHGAAGPCAGALNPPGAFLSADRSRRHGTDPVRAQRRAPQLP